MQGIPGAPLGNRSPEFLRFSRISGGIPREAVPGILSKLKDFRGPGFPPTVGPKGAPQGKCSSEFLRLFRNSVHVEGRFQGAWAPGESRSGGEGGGGGLGRAGRGGGGRDGEGGRGRRGGRRGIACGHRHPDGFNISTFRHFQHFNISTFNISTFQPSTFQHFNLQHFKI